MRLIREGRSKRVYQDPESEERVVIEFTDAAMGDNVDENDEISGKGELTCDLSYHLLGFLEGKGIDTHLIKSLSGPKLLCRKVDVIPIMVVCRNAAAGSFCERYGVEKGRVFESPVIELFVKDREKPNLLITRESAVLLGHMDSQTLALMLSITSSVNYYLSALLAQASLQLADLKLEFGIADGERVVVADEISHDTMTVWDSEMGSKSKKTSTRTPRSPIDSYRRLNERIMKTRGEEIPDRREIIEVIVEPKPGIRNPPGEITRKALVRLGFADVTEVRVGKLFKITLNGPLTSETLKQLNLMSIKLLSNPVSESHQVRP